MAYNPRYVVYCNENGNTPEEQLAKDREAWPGGCMCGYILWSHEKWRQYYELQGFTSDDVLYDADYVNYDLWLATSSNKEHGKMVS